MPVLLPYKPAVSDRVVGLGVEAGFRVGEVFASVFGCFLRALVTFQHKNQHADKDDCENSGANDDTEDDKVDFFRCFGGFDGYSIRGGGERSEEFAKVIHRSDSEVHLPRRD